MIMDVPDTTGRFWLHASDANLKDISDLLSEKCQKQVFISDPVDFVQLKWLFFFFTHNMA